jgi:hypothetical protein
MKKLLILLITFILFIPWVSADKNISNIFKIYTYEYDELNDVYSYYSQWSAVLINWDTVVTNAHVVLDEENEVIWNYELCKTIDFKTNPVCFSTGDLLYYDISKDLALLKLNKPVTNTWVIFSESKLDIWDTATTYWYPANWGWTISFTTWKISWFDLWKYKIDADIDSGSSWWAAFDEFWKLIWITSSVVVWYTTSGRIISMEDINNFINKSGQIIDFNDGISSDFQSYHDYISLYIWKNTIKNKYFELKNINNNKFNIIDIQSSKLRDVFQYQLESNTWDTSIDIKRSLTTYNDSDYNKIFKKLSDKLKEDKDIKFVFKELTLKWKKVYVVLNVNKKTKVFQIWFSSEWVSFDIEWTLNNTKELNSALKLYFKYYEVYTNNHFVDSVNIWWITVHKNENIDMNYWILGENNYFSLLWFTRFKEDTLWLITSDHYTFEFEDIEDWSNMEQSVQYFHNYYDDYEWYKVFDSGVVKNSYSKIFWYVAVKSDEEEAITYTLFSYNKYNDSYQYTFFILAFDINDKNIAQAVRIFVDSLDYTWNTVIPVDDKYNIKNTRHIR